VSGPVVRYICKRGTNTATLRRCALRLATCMVPLKQIMCSLPQHANAPGCCWYCCHCWHWCMMAPSIQPPRNSAAQAVFVFALLPLMTTLRGMALTDLPEYVTRGAAAAAALQGLLWIGFSFFFQSCYEDLIEVILQCFFWYAV
jgi:hypothetical protein